jgi:Zn finger protein HypA/HybF involved in hydrogenase expression
MVREKYDNIADGVYCGSCENSFEVSMADNSKDPVEWVDQLGNEEEIEEEALVCPECGGTNRMVKNYPENKMVNISVSDSSPNNIDWDDGF